MNKFKLIDCPVLQYSPGRSGSTLIAQILMILADEVEKMHDYIDTDRPVVISYRHPCDMFLSIWRIFEEIDTVEDLNEQAKKIFFFQRKKVKHSVNYVISQYQIMHQYYDSDKTNLLLLCYENFFSDYDYTFTKLEEFFKISIDQEIRDSIVEQTSIAKNKNRAGKMKNFDEYDRESLIHGNHILTGEPGLWKEVIPVSLQRKLLNKLDNEMEFYNTLLKSN